MNAGPCCCGHERAEHAAGRCWEGRCRCERYVEVGHADTTLAPQRYGHITPRAADTRYAEGMVVVEVRRSRRGSA